MKEGNVDERKKLSNRNRSMQKNKQRAQEDQLLNLKG